MQNIVSEVLRFGTTVAGNLTQAKTKKVAIIGAGNVGSAAASSMVHNKSCDEIALLDIVPGVAEGKALDLSQAAAAIGSHTKVSGSDNYSVIDNADIVVVTAGRSRKPGESRSDFLSMGAKILGPICEQIKAHAPNAKIIMVSNPLDVMAFMAQKLTGFAANRVMGMGGILDSSRMQEAIATKKGIPLQSVKTLVVGEHGDNMVPLFRLSTVNGKPADTELTADEQRDVVEATVKGGSKLANLLQAIKSASTHAPGAAIARMVQAIFNNTRETLPCSVQLNGNFGANQGLYAGVPAVLGENGVEDVPPLALQGDEKIAWDKSIAAIRANIVAAEEVLAKSTQPPLSAQPPAA
jgi:malate dehydrogenase